MRADKRWSSDQLRDALATLIGRDSRSFKLRKATNHSPEVRRGAETLRDLTFYHNIPLHVSAGRPLELDEEALAILPLRVMYRTGLGWPAPPPSVLASLTRGRKRLNEYSIKGDALATSTDDGKGNVEGGQALVTTAPVVRAGLVSIDSTDDNCISSGDQDDSGIGSGARGAGGERGGSSDIRTSSSANAIEDADGEGEYETVRKQQSDNQAEGQDLSSLVLRALEFPPGEDDIAAAAASFSKHHGDGTTSTLAAAVEPAPTVTTLSYSHPADGVSRIASSQSKIEVAEAARAAAAADLAQHEKNMSTLIKLIPCDSCWGENFTLPIKKNSTVAQVRVAVWQEMRRRGLIAAGHDDESSESPTTAASATSSDVAIYGTVGKTIEDPSRQPPESQQTQFKLAADRPLPGGSSPSALRLREKDRLKSYPVRIVRDTDGKLPRVTSVRPPAGSTRLLIAQALPGPENLGSVGREAVEENTAADTGDGGALGGESVAEPSADARVVVVQWWDRWTWRLTEKYEAWVSPTETVAAARNRLASQVCCIGAMGYALSAKCVHFTQQFTVEATRYDCVKEKNERPSKMTLGNF